MPGARALTWVGILALGLAMATGCFSERQPTAASEGLCTLPIGEGVAGSTVILIREFSFQPAEVHVRAGDRITWINCEENGPAHTSSADGGAWSSPLLAPSEAFTREFPTAGVFDYHCQPHPFMTARVVVE
jgi:plastocyanin